MEAAKIIDVYGSQPNFSKQQADARQVYTQALFQGVETWVRLPRSRWPKEWEGFEDPVSSHVGSLWTSGLRGDLGEPLCLAVGGQWLGSSSPEIW